MAQSGSSRGIEVNTCNPSDENQRWKQIPSSGAPGDFLLCLTSDDTCLTVDSDPGSKFIDGTKLLASPRNQSSPQTDDPRQLWKAQHFTGPAQAAVDFSLPDRVLGFGQHQNGKLDSRGLAFDMESCLEYGKSHGGEVCLPFVMGWSNATNSPQYAMLWNMPSFGGVSFGATAGDLVPSVRALAANSKDAQARHHATALRKGLQAPDSDTMSWTADGWSQYEIVVITFADAASSSEAQPAASALPASSIMQRYGSVVGTAPQMPEWALGYWHSKNRYSTQSSFEAAVEGFVSRSIPINVAVIDYNHWAHMGDWTFDPQYWPNPKAMVQNVSMACERDALAITGQGSPIGGEDERCVRIMVSAWPFTAKGSQTYDYVEQAGLGVKDANGNRSATGVLPPIQWPDPNCHTPYCWLYDPTHDASRDFYWSRLDAGYFDTGIDIFWLDASEPEVVGAPPAATQYSIGSQEKVGMMFPFWHTQAVQEGLHQEGKMDVVTITRSAWAGQARHAAATWSGDTQSTFESLQVSVPAGLNAQLSGISWWTLDIGGYSKGDPSNEEFNRLIVRWFEFGLTLPIFRQHGQRDTEPWVLANHTSYELVVDLIKARYTLSQFVGHGLNQTSEAMLPLMRPLPWDFPNDPATATNPAARGAYLFGDGMLARPIVNDNVTSVDLYLPKGPSSALSWVDCSSGKKYAGGTTVTVDTPLGTLPLFKRSDMSDTVDALLAAGEAMYPGKALPVAKVCVPGGGREM